MTYSIVAIDTKSGLMGVGVQSHYFSVGSVVPWVESGKGAVATQAMVDVSYGPRGLGLMSLGLSSTKALNCLLDEDSLPDTRQVAFLDTNGKVDVHTGASCIPEAGDHIGDGFSCQANMMKNDTVWDAMAESFESSKGEPLDQRILSAMRSAENEGGDIRGRQSAAIVISKIERSNKPWQDRLIDLRVEDNEWPLDELERLLRLSKAYRKADEGEDLMGLGDVDGAFGHYENASCICPENMEIMFWRAVTLAQAGEDEKAGEIFRNVFSREPHWRELLSRLTRCDMFDEDMAEHYLKK